MSSEKFIAFNLDKAIVLSFGEGLTHNEDFEPLRKCL